MFGRKRIFILMGIVTILLTILLGGKNLASARDPIAPLRSEVSTIDQSQPKPITLGEAWDLLDARAKKWQPDAGIADISSVDVQGDSTSSGSDGRRRSWLAFLVRKNHPTTELRVRLVDGTITEEIEQPAPSEHTPFANKPTLDSPKALASALAAKPGFQPGTDDIKGFEFLLDGAGDSLPSLRVRGSFHGKPATIGLDINKGTVLSAQIYTWEPLGGILYSSNGGQTWLASSLTGRMVTAIYPDPLHENQGYAAAVQNDHIAIYQTQNGGKTWLHLSDLPDQARDFGATLRVIYDSAYNSARNASLIVSTWTGLWISRDGKAWSPVEGLPQAPTGWMAVARSEGGYRVFVDITGGNTVGLYASTNLLKWSKLAEGTYRLSESFNQRMVLATSELNPTQSLLLTTSGQMNSQISGSVLHAAGDFSDPTSMILDDANIGVSKLVNQKMMATLTTGNGNLAASPDFPTSHLAIMGGFRTGISRSTDAGQTWKLVLADPSQIVPGTNELGDVQFLSRNSVIIINGGDQTWQDF